MKALVRLALALALMTGAIGCARPCNISGTITRDGKPLVWTSDEGHLLVIFVPANRKANRDVYRAETDREAGTYRINGILSGRYRVAIQQFDEKHNDALGHKYNPGKTQLEYDVTADGQVIDIDLP
jgi:hypothetical protein